MEKIAVVTGASYGLGEAFTEKLLTLGYTVYGVSRTTPKFTDQKFVWLQVDVLDEAQLRTLPEKIQETKIDLLVNNVGTAFLQKTLDYTDADFEKMFGLNFKVQVKVTQLLFDRLRGGLIINISSLSDRYPESKWGLYGASKAALNLFFETIAAEHREVRIVNMLPSYVDTPLQHELHDEREFDWSMCMKPDEVAEVLEHILEEEEKIESGSRIAVEKEVDEHEAYNPEKLWSFSVIDKKLRRVR